MPTFRAKCFFSAILTAGLLASSTTARADETTLPPDAVSRRDVVYADRPTGPEKLDLFVPAGEGPFPLVLWIHGGGWREGDKASWSHMNFLVGEGFAVANVEYRFSQVAPFPAQLDDCTAALDLLVARAAEFHIDPGRIAVSGESAGGHLAALVGMSRSAAATTQPTKSGAAHPAVGRIRAVIDLFGPTDLATVVGDPRVLPMVEALVGGPLAAHADLVRDASPLTHVAADNPPFLILHGTKDTLVPPAQSEHLAAALKAAGVKVVYLPIEGAGHAGAEFWTPEVRAKMRAFLEDAGVKP